MFGYGPDVCYLTYLADGPRRRRATTDDWVWGVGWCWAGGAAAQTCSRQQEQQNENQVELAWRCSLLLFASEFEAQSSAPGRNYKR